MTADDPTYDELITAATPGPASFFARLSDEERELFNRDNASRWDQGDDDAGAEHSDHDDDGEPTDYRQDSLVNGEWFD